MKTIKIGRISSGVEEDDGQLYPNFTAVTKLDPFEWTLFDKAKKIYDNISFENFCHEDSAGVEKITKEEAELELLLLHEDGCNPHVYLFSFDIPEYIWKNKKRLALERGYEDDVMGFINDFTDYSWNLESEREIEFPQHLLEMFDEFNWIQENQARLQELYMQFLIETGGDDDMTQEKFSAYIAKGNRDIIEM